MCSTTKDIPKLALSPERCHQLREGGILQLMVQLLHEHTIESHNQSAADFNLDSFIQHFNRKSIQRKQLSRRIRTIVENTAKDDSELEILGFLESVRAFVEKIYHSISHGSSHGIAAPDLEDMFEFIVNEETLPIFELFGGVFALLDQLRAQARFDAKFPNPVGVDLAVAMVKLPYLVRPLHLRVDLKRFLLNGSCFYATLAGLIKKTHGWDEKTRETMIRLCCGSLPRLKDSLDRDRHHLATRYPRRVFNQQYIRDYGLTKCLAEQAINNKHPETLSYVLEAIQSSGILVYDNDHRNVLEFCSVDGSVGALVDVLVPSEKKDNDVENAEWYEKQKLHSSKILHHINSFLLGHQIDPLLVQEQQLAKEQLLAIYESRNIVETLVHHLKLGDPNEDPDDDSNLASSVIEILVYVLECSEDQRRKFLEIDSAIETIKRFEELNYTATEILELFEE